MKKLNLFLISFLLLFAAAKLSYATTMDFKFLGTVNDGTVGSAEMEITINGHTLIVSLLNTSPINNTEEPGITAFGFDLLPSTLSLQSWELVANQYQTSTSLLSQITIGDGNSSTGDSFIDDDWKMGTSANNVDLDYLPATAIPNPNIDGALFNPLAVGLASLPGGSNDVFFTEATLTMIFNEDIEALVQNPNSVNGNNNPSPYVRMQAVGSGNDNSLKLPGIYEDPNNPPPNQPAVPEPGTMILLGFGLIGLAGIGRRKIKQ